MNRPDSVLVVDDDREIRELLAAYLAQHGLQVRTAADARQTWAALATQRPDLIVLDLMLPGEDGLSICRSLRQRGSAPIPVLMLTARNDESDRILGLEMGADDYLAKPFAARELLARIRAVLRRTRLVPDNLRQAENSGSYHFAGWQLDTRARHLLDPAGTLISLTGAEFRLLRVLLEHAQRVISRDQLLQLTQGREADVFDRSIDLLVSRLRKRLRDEAREARFIKTVRSEGYVFCAEVSASAAPPPWAAPGTAGAAAPGGL
ncbi:response regulator [Aquabacterium sp. OR-4]|uniref:response regulator n=1 Tax=Aquabacterium sp. OR-4 TaxID=2978127 RepID=UPI0021B1CC8E|nr:response regulator [Aquabacterium sp. OR-4]MDT7838381.1 response regulator [Aquabacterium sp. OR-4]